MAKITSNGYRGRLAPSPTGLLHLGHARTFWTAQQRSRGAGGRLFLRNDDLDTARCRTEFVAAMREDMAWFGLQWEEPMVSQSARIPLYRVADQDSVQIVVMHRPDGGRNSPRTMMPLGWVLNLEPR